MARFTGQQQGAQLVEIKTTVIAPITHSDHP